MTRTSTKVKTAALIEALEARRAALVAENEAMDAQAAEDLESLPRRQITALEDAISESLDGKVVITHHYHRDDVPEGEYQLELPQRKYFHKHDLSKYDNALQVLRLADPEGDQVVPHDGDFARLLR